MPINLPDLIMQFFVRQTVQLFERELNKPDGWEADPRTKTIRRRKPPRPREANRRAANPRRGPKEGFAEWHRENIKYKPKGSPGDVIDVCPKCFSVHEGRCPTT